MEEEGNLFDFNWDSVGGDSEEIDSSFFENETQSEPPKKEKKERKENKEDSEEESDLDGDLIDTSFFEKENNNDNEEIDDTSQDDDSSADNSSSPLMQKFASTLLAEGVITLDEGEEIKSAKDLINAMRKTISSNEYSDLTENQRTYMESLRNGIPEEEIKANFNNIKALESITPDMIKANEQLQKTLIAQDFIAKGMAEDKAFKMADRSITLGESSDDALEAYSSLKEIESTRLTEENNRIKEEKKKEEQEALTRLERMKSTILEKKDLVPGVKYNATTREKIFENISKVVDYDKKGNGINAITKARLADPETFEIMEAALFTITKGFTDFSKFKTDIKSNAIDELDKALSGTQTGSGNSHKITSSSSKGLLDALKQFG